MTQFKPLFTGQKRAVSSRLTSPQESLTTLSRAALSTVTS